MENLLLSIMRQRGFEFEEPFQMTLNGQVDILKATENGLKIKLKNSPDDYRSEKTTWEIAAPVYMNNLVLGNGELEAIPFKPQVGQRYFYVDCKKDSVDDVDEVKGCIMEKTQVHAYRVASGNCFIVRRQADENVQQMREMYVKIFKNVNDWSE